MPGTDRYLDERPIGCVRLTPPVVAPAGDRVVRPKPARMPTDGGRDLDKRPIGCVGLALLVATPAGDRVVRPKPARMPSPSRHLGEQPRRCVRLALLVATPAGDRVVRPKPARMVTTSRHLDKRPRRCVPLTKAVPPPASDRVVRPKPARVGAAGRDLDETLRCCPLPGLSHHQVSQPRHILPVRYQPIPITGSRGRHRYNQAKKKNHPDRNPSHTPTTRGCGDEAARMKVVAGHSLLAAGRAGFHPQRRSSIR